MVVQMMPDPTIAKILARQTVAKDLSHFAGEPEKWPRFRKEFKRISEECGYSDSENMARLEKALKGPALSAVEYLLAFSENVSEVRQRLVGQHKLRIIAMIDKIKKIYSNQRRIQSWNDRSWNRSQQFNCYVEDFG